jgi:hypothetical protein
MAHTALPMLTDLPTASELMDGTQRPTEPGVPGGVGVALGAGAWPEVAEGEGVGDDRALTISRR